MCVELTKGEIKIMGRNKHSNVRKNWLFQRWLMVVIVLGLSSVSLKGAAQQFGSSKLNFLSIHSSSSNQLDDNVAQQNTDKTQPANSQRDVDKETRREERNLEKEAKQDCEISSDRGNRKSKKCEPSIYEQMYPGVDFQAQDKNITDQLLRELKKDARFKDRTFVE
jgi:hypothetical protein